MRNQCFAAKFCSQWVSSPGGRAWLRQKQLKKKTQINSVVSRSIIHKGLSQNPPECHQYFKYWAQNWLSSASQQFPGASLLGTKSSGGAEPGGAFWAEFIWLCYVFYLKHKMCLQEQTSWALPTNKESAGCLCSFLNRRNDFIIPTWGGICLFIVSNFCTQGKY